MVLNEDNASASAYSNLGNVHLQTGRAALALQDFSRAITLAPEARRRWAVSPLSPSSTSDDARSMAVSVHVISERALQLHPRP